MTREVSGENSHAACEHQLMDLGAGQFSCMICDEPNGTVRRKSNGEINPEHLSAEGQTIQPQ
jgi:hypothetical protein